MAEQQAKPAVLQKPPDYKDPTGTVRPAPVPGPGPRLPKPPCNPPVRQSFPPTRRRKSNCCRICCCCFCFLVSFLILLIIVAGGVFYLWFEPKLPVFHLQSFSFPHFNVSVKSDGTYLTAATLMRVEVRNPNGKLRFYYGATNVDVSAGKDKDEIDLGSAKVPGFTQGTKNATSLKIETKSDGEPVDDGTGPRLMSRYKNKYLVVNVGVKTSVSVIVQGLKIRPPLTVSVICGGQTLKDLDQMPKCTINFLKWINIH